MNAMNLKEQPGHHGLGGGHTGEHLPLLLSRLDPLPLECDGMTRVLSTLLARDEIPHHVVVGSLTVNGAGSIDLHWWIELLDGRVCDLRARMWLGTEDRVPHGCFLPEGQQQYEARSVLEAQALHPGIFAILAGAPMESFPAWTN
ncbi:hypothetical protein [Acidovorax sp.]|uniref:hypothetical protein n=1 Tax=Acidovorax sp. TaxID=1872122 RepID=UPI00391F6084